MEQLFYYLKVSLISIKRAPLPYALTLLVLSTGLGVFFSNATLYYWLNSDPLPAKSSQLFFPRINSVQQQCDSCLEPLKILSYQDVQLLSANDIATAQAAMYSSTTYARLPNQQGSSPTAVSLRVTQKDFFQLFSVPFLHGQPWPDNNARMEIILARNTALKFFGRTNVLGEQLQLDQSLFTVVGVLDDWQMIPRLYDVNTNRAMNSAEDIYLPFETGYDSGFSASSQTMSFDNRNYNSDFGVQAREGQYYMLQFWLQLDGPEQQQAYQQFMDNLVASEQAAGRHPRAKVNHLHNLLDVMDAFDARNRQSDAFALVSLLFLLVCLFNACHLSMNRYLAGQYEFSLRRALGARRLQLMQQVLVDVLVNTGLAFVLSLGIALLFLGLITYLLPSMTVLSRWQPPLLLAMLGLAFFCCYLVTLYPALRASFSPLNQQLK